MYLSAVMSEMPTGFPTIRRKDTGFRAERKHCHSEMSREWLDFVAYKNNITLETVFNIGERKIGQRKIKVDGFDAANRTIYQFHGCLWHGHDCELTWEYDINPVNRKSLEDLHAATVESRQYLENTVNMTVVEMRECEWKIHKKRNPEVQAFLNTRVKQTSNGYQMTEGEILHKVTNGSLFGLIQCDVRVPVELEQFFAEMQPIFKNTDVSRDDFGEHMRVYAEERKMLRQPRRTLIGSFFGTQLLFATPLLQWYIKHGLVVNNITIVIVYAPATCFKQFGENVSNARRKGDVDLSQAIIADTYKLLGNSAYGKTLTNLAKHRDVKFLDEVKTRHAINQTGFRSVIQLDENLYEVSLNKSKVVWDLPLHIGYMVYQYAKLRMLEFHYDFLDRFVSRDDFQLLEMDTDSLYIALSAPTLEDVIKPELREAFYDAFEHWFPSKACAVHKDDFKATRKSGQTWDRSACQDCQQQHRYDQRTPGLFKTEYSGDGFIGLCSKTYYCFTEGGKDKYSSKGLNKTSVTREQYQNVLRTKTSGSGVNQGFRVKGTDMLTYVQQRDSLSYLYIKRVVSADGVSTGPIRV